MPTPEELERALAALLAPHERRDDPLIDLVAAARRSLERRESNSRDGGVVIEELRERGLTWRAIATLTGISKDTAQRWAEPPGERS